MARGYSFRFYGRQPTDWIEGANDGHLFSVQFKHTPSDEELEEIARLYERTLATGIARPSPGAWHWSERFAAFTVGERWFSRGGHIGAVTDFFMEARGVVPIVDVVYHNAIDGTGSWDLWSLGQSTPDAAPDFGTFGNPKFQRPAEPSLPAPAPSAAFEEWRKSARESMATAKVEDAIATRKKGKVGLARLPAQATPLRAEWPEEILAKFEIPEEKMVEYDVLGTTHRGHAPGEHIIEELVERPIAWVQTHLSNFTSFVWLDETGARCEPDWPDPVSNLWGISLHPKGDEALVRSSNVARHIDLKTRVVREIYCKQIDDGYELRGTAFVDGGARWAVVSDKQLLVFDPRSEPPKMVEKAKCKATSVLSSHNGNILVTSNYGENPKVFAFAADTLKNVGTFKAKFNSIFETDGRVIFTLGDVHYELTHVDEVYEIFVNPKKKGAKRAKGKKKAPKPELSLSVVDEIPPEEPSPEKERAKKLFSEGSFVVAAESGRAAALLAKDPEVDHFRTFYSRLAFVDGGNLVEVTEALDAARGNSYSIEELDINPEGSSVIVRSMQSLFEITIPSGEVRVALEGAYEWSGGLKQFGFIDNDTLLVLGQKSLFILKREAEGWVKTAAAKPSKAQKFGWIGEHKAAVVITESKYPIDVFSLTDKGLKRVGRFLDPANSVFVREDRAFVAVGETQRREIIGLKEVTSP